MTPYGTSKTDSRTCRYGCCHGSRAGSKYINVRCSTDHGGAKDFKSAASASGRGKARSGARREIVSQLNEASP